MLARHFVVGIGIALIFPMLVYYGFCSVVPAPRYEQYYDPTLVLAPNSTPDERKAYYERRSEQAKHFQYDRARFAKKLIMVMAPIGIAAMLGGYFLGVNAIGTGLLVGGMIAVVYGYSGYWAFLYPWMRFSSLLAGFVILLLIGAKHIGFTWPPQPALARKRVRRNTD